MNWQPVPIPHLSVEIEAHLAVDEVGRIAWFFRLFGLFGLVPDWPHNREVGSSSLPPAIPRSPRFGTLKQRCVWREEFETLDEAHEKIGANIDRYHHRPHSRPAYRTPREVAAT